MNIPKIVTIVVLALVWLPSVAKAQHEDSSPHIELGPQGPFDSVRFSPKDSLAKAAITGRQNIGEHEIEHDRLILLRPCLRLTADEWSVCLQGTFLDTNEHDTARLDQANAAWSHHLLGCDVTLRCGREYLPTLDSVPQPHAGALIEDALPDEAFDSYGDGVALEIKPCDSVRLTAKFFKLRDECRLPARGLLGASWHLPMHMHLGAMGQTGATPERDWLVSGEVGGEVFEDRITYELLGVYRRHLAGERVYGGDALVSCKLTHEIGTTFRFDWLEEKPAEKVEHIVHHTRFTAGVWVEPIRFLRLEVDMAGDWKHGEHHNAGIEIAGAMVARF